MLRSMYASVSGLRAMQQMMDVVGNNISNVNTAGFKASRVTFTDTLSQLISGASAANGSRGGTNAQQVGLGVRVGATDLLMTQGSTQLTGRSGDLAVQGEGFFAVRDGQQMLYTRAGSFNFDDNGSLVAPNGDIVQGWVANQAGTINTAAPVSDVKIGLGVAYPPTPTGNVVLGGNLSNDATTGTVINSSIEVIDSLGAAHRMSVSFTKTATANEWTQTVTDDNGNTLGTQTLDFDAATGALTNPATPPSFTYTPTSGAVPLTFTTGYGQPGQTGALTQYGGDTTAAALSQDGTATGYLRSVSFGADGTVTGVFTNGKTQSLARVATATFSNPGGLTKSGDSMFSVSNNSGAPTYATAGTNGHGALAAGALEMSNVDLSQEFTNLIVAQRGFQANSKVVTVSDQILNELVNMKQ